MATATLGPAGGAGGRDFNNYTVPDGARITAVHVWASRYVDALQIVYSDADGNVDTLPRIGGEGGEDYVFALEADEYLTGISGRSGWYIDELRIHTNKRTSEAFGSGGGFNEFEFNAPDGHAVVGFWGRADWYIDALGVVMRPTPKKRGRKAKAPQAGEGEPVIKGASAAKGKKRKPQEGTDVQAEAAEVPAGAGEPVVKGLSAAKKKGKAKAQGGVKDLQKVEGIGPKIATLLADNGVGSLQALAETPVARLEEILKQAGRRYAIASPETWPEQAALGARGDWEGLEKMQATLKGGRRL